MDLYVIRHGIAVDLDSPGLGDDSLRPLSDKGRKKMLLIAAGLLKMGVRFNLILSSPYARARETAEILADVLQTEDKPFLSEHLSLLGDLDLLVDEIFEHRQLESLALVGHEPGLTSLISFLLTGNFSAVINLKKGAVCCLTMDQANLTKKAVLDWMLTPSQLAFFGEKTGIGR